MSIAQEKLEQIRAQVQTHLDRRQSTELTAARKDALESTIRGHLKAHNAVIVAHYYTAPEIQALAEATGGCVSDSLEMARFGRDHEADTLIVAGVRFMGETAKILTPHKRVLMPTLEATCSLDEGCPIDEFSEFCDATCIARVSRFPCMRYSVVKGYSRHHLKQEFVVQTHYTLARLLLYSL